MKELELLNKIEKAVDVISYYSMAGDAQDMFASATKELRRLLKTRCTFPCTDHSLEAATTDGVCKNCAEKLKNL